MGLLDSLMGAATNAAFGGQQNNQSPSGTGGMDPQMLIGIVGALLSSAGGLQGLLNKLQQGGLGDAAASWVGTGGNQSVSPDALGSALGPDLMGMITSQLGGNSQQAAGVLASVLPGLVDQLTPKGQMPADDGLGALGALLGGGKSPQGGLDAGDLMGMLGGLMGKR